MTGKMPEVIRSRRSALNLSQADLAVLTGVDKRQIRRYEAGKTQPVLSVALALARALEVTVDELAGGVTDTHPEQCSAVHPRFPHRRCERPAGHPPTPAVGITDETNDLYEHWNTRADPPLSWWDTVPVPRTAAELMVGHILDHLHEADRQEGCCPVCCGACAALNVLARAGDLSRLAAGRSMGAAWWTDANEVDWNWLQHAWRMTSCHQGDEG